MKGRRRWKGLKWGRESAPSRCKFALCSRKEERSRRKEREKERVVSTVEIAADRGSRRMNFGMNAPREYLDRAVASVSLLPKLTAERRIKMVAGRYSRVSKNDAFSRQRITTGRVSFSRLSFPSSSFSLLSQHPPLLALFFPFSASKAYPRLPTLVPFSRQHNDYLLT